MKSGHFLTVIIVACTMLFAGAAQANDNMKDGMRHRMMGHMMPMGEGCCDKNLPPAKAKMVEGSMHETMEKNKPLFERMRKLHEKMRAIATADKFDKKAFLATSSEMAALHMKMEKNRAETMARVAEQLTGPERRNMAKCMEENFHRGEFRHEGWEHKGDGGMMNSHNGSGHLND